jgi:tRNA pseudouridine13 synthase
VKVKQRAEDFRVEEVNRLEAGAEGIFTLYRLEKSGLDTREALRLVAREWRLSRNDIRFAGLKDRYGLTGQVVSVRKGPARNFEARQLRLNYLGRSAKPAARGTIEKNRFRIVLRDLSGEECERALARARAVACCGLPDYFDDQRFGSLRGTGGDFVARALLEGDAEKALRLAIASPARKDRSRVKKRRRLLRDRWGVWQELTGLLEPSVERRICEHLAKGGAFGEAYRLLDPALRSLHLSAFQAHLFNECLRRTVGEGGPVHSGQAGPYLFYRGDPGELRDLRLPLASKEAAPHPLLDANLEACDLDRAALGRLSFRPGTRGAVVPPDDLEATGPEPDELNAGRHAVTLAFSLRAGSYATMLVKRCTYDM